MSSHRFFHPTMLLLVVSPGWLPCVSAARAEDCNRNGVEDAIEIAAGDAADCNANTRPDECDLGPVVSFVAGADLPFDDNPGYIAVADFDGDEWSDLAVANDPYASSGETRVSLLFNDGSGNFEPPVDYVLEEGGGAGQIVAEDFNSDSFPDLALVIPSGGGMSVLVNDGLGRMLPANSYNFGSDLWGIAAGDWDGDNDVDLVASDFGSHRVYIFSNDGQGAFAATDVAQVPVEPSYFGTGDVDGDSDLDIAVGSFNGDAISLLFNGGDGSFSEVLVFDDAPYTTGLIFLDLDLDGDLDLSATSCSESVWTFNNFGDHVFHRLYVDYSDCAQVLVGADYDRDGDEDVMSVAYSSYLVSYYENRGNGTLQTDIKFALGDSSTHAAGYGMAAGDFDHDGDSDVAVSSSGFPVVTILWNDTYVGEYSQDCDRNLVPDECDLAGDPDADCDSNGVPDVCEDCNQNGVGDACDISSGETPDCNANALPDSCDLTTTLRLFIPAAIPGAAETVVAGDIDADRDSDLISADSDGNIVAWFNDGRANFDEPILLEPDAGEDVQLFLADFNLDGALDLCAITPSKDAVLLRYGSGDGTFSDPVEVVTGGEETAAAVVADLNGDGWSDLATANQTSRDISILINDGAGNLLATLYDQGSKLATITSGDFDGDGDADLVAGGEEFDGIVLLLNDGTGLFAGEIHIPVYGGPLALASVDLNVDGFADLIVGEQSVATGQNSQGGVEVYFGSADAELFLATSIQLGRGPSDVKIVDLEPDGDMDVLVISDDNSGIGWIDVLTQSEDSILCVQTSVQIGHDPRELSVADFDANGYHDFITANAGEAYLSLILNLSTPPVSMDSNSNAIPDECEALPACAGDANGDGTVDPLDTGYVLSRFGCSVGQGDASCDAADVNGDQQVDPLDAGFVLSRLGVCDG